MTERRIKSMPGGAGATSCAKPSNGAYRNNPYWDEVERKKKAEKEKKLKQIIQSLLIFGGESLKSKSELKGELKNYPQRNQMNISTQEHCNPGLLQLFLSKARK